MNLSELKAMKITAIAKMAKELNIDMPGALHKQDLIFQILEAQKSDDPIEAEGVLEVLPDGYGFLRSPYFSFNNGRDDIYVSPSQIRRFNLRTGDMLKGQVRPPKDSERYAPLIKIDQINFSEPVEGAQKVLFDNLTALYPTRTINLEHSKTEMSTRIINLLNPIGFGQRALIVAPPRAGQDRSAPGHGARDRREPSRGVPHRAAHRRAARGSHRHAAHGEGRGRFIDVR